MPVLSVVRDIVSQRRLAALGRGQDKKEKYIMTQLDRIDTQELETRASNRRL